MGLFGNWFGKERDCIRRAKSWYPGIPALEDAAKKACKENPDLTREEFGCSGIYVDQLATFDSLQIDVCPTDDITPMDGFQGQAAQAAMDDAARQWEETKPIIYGLGLLVAAGMAILYILKRG